MHSLRNLCGNPGDCICIVSFRFNRSLSSSTNNSDNVSRLERAYAACLFLYERLLRRVDCLLFYTPDAIESALHEQRLRRCRWNSDGSARSAFLHRPDAYLFILLKNYRLNINANKPKNRWNVFYYFVIFKDFFSFLSNAPLEICREIEYI